MALVRGFSVLKKEIEDGYEDDPFNPLPGYIIIPSNIRYFLGVEPNEDVIINALRIEGTTRYPHAVFFLHDYPPLLSPAELIMAVAAAPLDERGKIVMPSNILEVMRLQHNYRVEMKVLGPHDHHWVMVYNRGPRRFTTVRERMGIKRGKLTASIKHKPDTQVWEY